MDDEVISFGDHEEQPINPTDDALPTGFTPTFSKR
jgi:hypothetical protein